MKTFVFDSILSTVFFFSFSSVYFFFFSVTKTRVERRKSKDESLSVLKQAQSFTRGTVTLGVAHHTSSLSLAFTFSSVGFLFLCHFVTLLR